MKRGRGHDIYAAKARPRPPCTNRRPTLPQRNSPASRGRYGSVCRAHASRRRCAVLQVARQRRGARACAVARRRQARRARYSTSRRARRGAAAQARKVLMRVAQRGARLQKAGRRARGGEARCYARQKRTRSARDDGAARPIVQRRAAWRASAARRGRRSSGGSSERTKNANIHPQPTDAAARRPTELTIRTNDQTKQITRTNQNDIQNREFYAQPAARFFPRLRDPTKRTNANVHDSNVCVRVFLPFSFFRAVLFQAHMPVQAAGGERRCCAQKGNPRGEFCHGQIAERCAAIHKEAWCAVARAQPARCCSASVRCPPGPHS